MRRRWRRCARSGHSKDVVREIYFEGDGFEVPLLTSAVLPERFRHGFTTRVGGVSAAPFDTLNLGGRWGDRREDVLENRRRVQLAAGGQAIFFATQVHGREVARVEQGTTPDGLMAIDADAVFTTLPEVPVGVYVADCVPILVADERTGACAAVHAGWRGTVAGVLAAAVARLVADAGARAADLRVAIGPSIGPCCFEVGPEVVAAVEAAFPAARAAGAILERSPRPHVDLPRLNRMAAEGAGVSPDAIDVAGLCTSCDRGRFYSYRRDHGRTGQLAAFVVRRG